MAFPFLACDGCFVGFPAVLSLIIAVVVLIGSIYMLLWSNFGARQAYLIVMVALSGWMIIMSAIWLFGAPGTTTSTGPRGREPAWVPFLPDSEQAGDFKPALDVYPNRWDATGTVYPGMIDSKGEMENVRTIVGGALARLAEKQGTGATSADDWRFFPSDQTPQTDLDKELPKATVRFYRSGSTPLLFGVTIPATDKHPEVTVFAYRDKGLVFLNALYFLIASLLGFVVHLWLLARHERKQTAQAEERTPEPALA